MPTIDELKGMASSKLGFARSNSYLVELPTLASNPFGRLSSFIPSIPGITGGGIPSTRELNILCKNVNMPGKQILTSDRRIGMVFEKIAYGYAVDDVSLTFYLLNDYGVMSYLNEWRSKVINEDNYTVGYKNEYQYPVTIHQLRKPLAGLSASAGPIRVNVGVGGGSVYSVQLENAFPTTISPISFSNDLDGLVEVTVQLSYTNWKPVTASQNFIEFDVNPGQIFG